MKTRILHTKFWQDSFVADLSPSERLVFVYLLSNHKINMSGIYEMSGREISFDTGISLEEIKFFAKKLQDSKKMFFFRNWICITNHDRYNSYGKGEKQIPALIRELSYIPQEFWNALKEWDTSIYTSRYTRLNTEYRNPNKESRSILSPEDEEKLDNIIGSMPSTS